MGRGIPNLAPLRYQGESNTFPKAEKQKYIDLTDNLIRKYRSRCDCVGELIKSMTVEQVVEVITRDTQEVFELDIVAYGRAYAKQLENEGRIGTAKSYTVALNSLARYVERENISIKNVYLPTQTIFLLYKALCINV